MLRAVVFGDGNVAQRYPRRWVMPSRTNNLTVSSLPAPSVGPAGIPERNTGGALDKSDFSNPYGPTLFGMR